jgi:hypothetical protein
MKTFSVHHNIVLSRLLSSNKRHKTAYDEELQNNETAYDEELQNNETPPLARKLQLSEGKGRCEGEDEELGGGGIQVEDSSSSDGTLFHGGLSSGKGGLDELKSARLNLAAAQKKARPEHETSDGSSISTE